MMHRTQTHMATRTVPSLSRADPKLLLLVVIKHILMHCSTSLILNVTTAALTINNQHIRSLFPIVKCYRKKLMFTVTRVCLVSFGGGGGEGNVYCHQGLFFVLVLFIY